MELGIFSIVLFSAFTHASWNYFSKKISGNLQIVFAGLWVAHLCLLPYSIFITATQGLSGIRFILITAVSHILYYTCLSKSYRSGDLSTVYPISRGTGIAGTAIAAYFFIGERFSAYGLAGIIAIVSGVLFISLKKRGTGRDVDLKTYLYTFGVGGAIIIQSIFDKMGVAYINPIVYLNFKDMLALLIMSPFVFRQRKTVKEVFVKNWKYSLIIGFGAVGSYILILIAFQYGSVGYISALREFAIVIGAILGIVFLKEKMSRGKIIGIIFIVIGLILIKIS